MTKTYSALRDAPHFAATVASRAWNAWWIDSPVPLAEYRTWVDECITSSGIPNCFVAHDGETYLGSVKLIASDLEARPNYTPWIAALWVDEAHRRQGIAQGLMNHARVAAKAAGHDLVYLCAMPSNSAYYLKRGFIQIESDVTGLDVFTIGVRHD